MSTKRICSKAFLSALEDLGMAQDCPVEGLRGLLHVYWDRLTRCPDADHLEGVFQDEKVQTDPVLYVPTTDSVTWRYYCNLRRHELPQLTIEPLDMSRGLLGLRGLRPGLLATQVQEQNGILKPSPYVVPGGRFNELYGWDSYFIIRGLLESGRLELAKAQVENQIYEVEHYGQVLNANRTYFLSRSQPPFLLFSGLEVAAHFEGGIGGDLNWLARLLAAVIKEYDQVWTGPHKCTANGLSRYYDPLVKLCDAVEPGHYSRHLAGFAAKYGMSVEEFESKVRAGAVTDIELLEFIEHDGAMRESGHDSSRRVVGKAAKLNSVLLNSLLYRIESTVGWLIENYFNGFAPGAVRTDSATWYQLAKARKTLMNEHMWCQKDGVFYDYDYVGQSHHRYRSPVVIGPLWAGLATPAQARSTIKFVKDRLLFKGGLASSDAESRGIVDDARPQLQWDLPFGWAPHQMMFWDACGRYGFDRLKQDSMYRWCSLVAAEAVRTEGAIAEKYDVVNGTSEAQAEYGNVGAGHGMGSGGSGFGWTNASLMYGLNHFNRAKAAELHRLLPPVKNISVRVVNR
jgi:alpha,alpha-trehalase